MERRQKREIARQMANLEKRHQRATTSEEKALVEEEMTRITMQLVDGLSEDTFDFAAMEYIDDYVQRNLKVDNQKNK